MKSWNFSEDGAWEALTLFLEEGKYHFQNTKARMPLQGFSNLSEVRVRGLLNLGKKDLEHQNWET